MHRLGPANQNQRRDQHDAQPVAHDPIEEIHSHVVCWEKSDGRQAADPHQCTERAGGKYPFPEQPGVVPECRQVVVEPGIACQQRMAEQCRSRDAQGSHHGCDSGKSAPQLEYQRTCQYRPGVAPSTEKQHGQCQSAGGPEHTHHAIWREIGESQHGQHGIRSRNAEMLQ